MTCQRKWWRQEETTNLWLWGLVEKKKQLTRTDSSGQWRTVCPTVGCVCSLQWPQRAPLSVSDSDVAPLTKAPLTQTGERSGGRDLENCLVLTLILLWMENYWKIKMYGRHQLTTFLGLLFSRLWISSFLAPFIEMLIYTKCTALG